MNEDEHSNSVRLTEADNLFKLKMNELERDVFDAYEILWQAQQKLFFSDNIISDRMTLQGFKYLMIEKLKEIYI